MVSNDPIIPTSCTRLSRTLASEPEWPWTSALVESQTSARTPSSPSAWISPIVNAPPSRSGPYFPPGALNIEASMAALRTPFKAAMT